MIAGRRCRFALAGHVGVGCGDWEGSSRLTTGVGDFAEVHISHSSSIEKVRMV